MKKITSLLLIMSAIALLLCGCKSNKEIDETTSVSETTTVSTSEFNSFEVTTTEFAQSDEATIEGSKSIDGFTDPMETDIRDFDNPFPKSAVFLRDIYDEILSTEDGSYLELQNQLPKRITDTIEKYGKCTLFASRSYYPEYSPTFYSNTPILETTPIYYAKTSYDSSLSSYSDISNVVLLFDKTTGMFLLQGIDSSRKLVQYDFDGDFSVFLGSPETLYDNIDIMDADNKKKLHHIRNSYMDATAIYDEQSKEIAIYQLGKKLDSFSIDLSNMNFTREWFDLRNYPFLDNESNLMMWQDTWMYTSIDYIEKISENVKQKIASFREISDIGLGNIYTLYEKEDGSFLIVEYSHSLTKASEYSCHPITSIDDSLYLHFSVDDFGRCYLYKDFFMDDLHLVDSKEYICYIPEKHRNAKLLHLQFSYSELDEKIEEVLKYSES